MKYYYREHLSGYTRMKAEGTVTWGGISNSTNLFLFKNTKRVYLWVNALKTILIWETGSWGSLPFLPFFFLCFPVIRIDTLVSSDP